MKFLLNTKTFLAVGAMVSAFALSAPAAAECLTCDDGDDNPSSTSTSLTGGAGTSGLGVADFAGTGSSWSDTDGDSDVSLTLGQEGDLCEGDCEDLTGGLSGHFNQNSGAGANAESDESEEVAEAVGEVGSSGQLTGSLGENQASFQLGATSLGAGQAASVFGGNQGGSYAGTEGSTTVSGNLDITGLCGNCEDGHYGVNAGADESAWGSSWATSDHAGQPAMSESMSGVEALIELDLGSSFGD